MILTAHSNLLTSYITSLHWLVAHTTNLRDRKPDIEAEEDSILKAGGLIIHAGRLHGS